MCWWDDPTPTSSNVHDMHVDDQDDEPSRLCAVLWLPDPDTQRGWGAKRIWKEPDTKRAQRIGFRPNRRE